MPSVKRSLTYGGAVSRKKRKVTVATVNAKVNKVLRTQEKKAFDWAVKSNQSSPRVYFTPTGTVDNLTAIPGGDDINQREGRRIALDSLMFRYHIRMGTTGGALDNYRLMIVCDKYPNAGVASAAEILDFSTIIAGEEALAPLNLGNRDRFQVLYDDTSGTAAKLQKYGTATEGQLTDVIQKKYLKMDKQTTYADLTATVPQTGALLLVTVGNQWASATVAPSHHWTWVSRTRFIDS